LAGRAHRRCEEHLRRPLLSSAVAQLEQGAGDGRLLLQVERRLASERAAYDYAAVCIISLSGNLTIHSPASHRSATARDRALASEALATGQVRTSDLYLEADGKPGFVVAAPLAALAGSGRPGAVLLHIDPASYLYPFIQSWPLPSSSGETLLVQRRGDRVLYLNELRYRSGTALRLQLPLRPDLPATRALSGTARVMQGLDYRGAPVFAAFRPVEGTDWAVVAKLDTAEVLGPLTTRALITAAVTVLLVLLAGAGTMVLWRSRELRTAAALAAGAERYRSLVEGAPLAIMVNRDDRVVLVNAACLRLFGAQSPEELLGKSPFELFDPSCHENVRARIRTLREEHHSVPLAEERIVRLDGRVVDVAAAAAPFNDGAPPPSTSCCRTSPTASPPSASCARRATTWRTCSATPTRPSSSGTRTCASRASTTPSRRSPAWPPGTSWAAASSSSSPPTSAAPRRSRT